jgi:3-oxoacyl-[acyl-carrier protein] reductase
MRSIDLSGKAALITGGTRNIGRAIAGRLAEAGADVALFYRSDEAAAARARAEIRAATGRRAEVYRVDVGDEAAVEAGVARALADFGGAFPIVVHNAGHGDGGGRMPEIRTDQWRGTLAVNLDAAFFLTRALLRRGGDPGSALDGAPSPSRIGGTLRRSRRSGRGFATPCTVEGAPTRACGALPPGSSVVFIGSGRGHAPAAEMASYGTAKAALLHFAAILAQDVGPRGIRVNVVSPGFTDTDHAPEAEKPGAAARAALRRLGTPEDVAGAVLFFASDLAAFVTGQWLRVDGGAG